MPIPSSRFLALGLPLTAIAAFGLAGCGESGGGADSGTASEQSSETASAQTAETPAVDLDTWALNDDEYKVLRLPMTTSGPNTLDPVRGSTQYDSRVLSCIYDTVIQYQYLARPHELEPSLLTSMPEISEDGKTWKFELQPGITFHDDACFPDGEGREMVAEDVVFSWKRLADPRYDYKNWWLVDGQIVGFNEYKESQKTLVDGGAEFDYDLVVPGLRTTGKYTFEVQLTESIQQFIWKLAMFQMSVVPREAVEMYGEGFNGHTVGSGAYRLDDEDDWVRGSSITLKLNEEYRDDRYPTTWSPEDEELGLHEAAGRRVPFVDELQMYFFVEPQPSWLEFNAGNLDMTTVPAFAFEEAFNRRTKELKREYTERGIRDEKVRLNDFIFRSFNMEDELLGGYTDDKKALRQAFNLAMDWDELNEAQYFGLAIAYDGPIPPTLKGGPKKEDNYRAPYTTRGPDYERARAKLREAGFTVVDGKVTDLPPIDLYTSQGAESVRIVELMQRNLAEVGIRINPRYLDFANLIDAVNSRKAPFFSFAWGSDYPDAENNLALFYGPNASPGSNHSNYANPEYDALYERIRTMPDSPERTEVYERMRDMLIADAPFTGSLARQRVYLVPPWTKNTKPIETFWNWMKYLDVDMSHPERGDG